MKTLFILLQAQAQPQGSSASMWILLLLMFVVMWFFMIRPQRKQQKELEAFQNSLKKGDKVIIGNSGIFGEIVEVNDRTSENPAASSWQGVALVGYLPGPCRTHLAVQQPVQALFRGLGRPCHRGMQPAGPQQRIDQCVDAVRPLPR